MSEDEQEMSKSQEKKHHCPTCDKSFGRADHLKSHLLTHEKAKGFHCSVEDCAYSTKWKQRLYSHIKVVHNNVKAHQCPECSYKAAQKSDLTKHENRIDKKKK